MTLSICLKHYSVCSTCVLVVSVFSMSSDVYIRVSRSVFCNGWVNKQGRGFLWSCVVSFCCTPLPNETNHWSITYRLPTLEQCHEGPPWRQNSWAQNGAQLGPAGPRWAPCWSHEPCYLGSYHWEPIDKHNFVPLVRYHWQIVMWIAF